MKAKMKTNLIDRYIKLMFVQYGQDTFEPDVIDFLESIEGKEVKLVFENGDAFEATENDTWLPDGLWDYA